MHWVVQQGVLKPANFDLLVAALERAEVRHSIVAVPRGESRLVPEVSPSGKVMVCGALKMAEIARERGWSPGSFLNENFEHSVWAEALAGELLNVAGRVARLGDVSLERDSFVRPAADNKAFDGRLFRSSEFEAWKVDNPSLLELPALVAPPITIYSEFRLFMIGGKVVTGSQYMRGGSPHLSDSPDPEVVEYAEAISSRWRPADAFVVDVARTVDGCKVIEFNNINSSGFYASDVGRYVHAMEDAFG